MKCDEGVYFPYSRFLVKAKMEGITWWAVLASEIFMQKTVFCMQQHPLGLYSLPGMSFEACNLVFTTSHLYRERSRLYLDPLCIHLQTPTRGIIGTIDSFPACAIHRQDTGCFLWEFIICTANELTELTLWRCVEMCFSNCFALVFAIAWLVKDYHLKYLPFYVSNLYTVYLLESLYSVFCFMVK